MVQSTVQAERTADTERLLYSLQTLRVFPRTHTHTHIYLSFKDVLVKTRHTVGGVDVDGVKRGKRKFRYL
jgi:hypothetical protein